MSVSIKSVSVEKMQEVIASALSELTSGPCTVKISDLKFETPPTGGFFGAENVTLTAKIEFAGDKNNPNF